MGKKEYKLNVDLYGLRAYVVDELHKTGLFGLTKEGVVEGIIAKFIAENLGDLERFGLTMKDAEKKGYIPIKLKEDDS